VFGDREVEVEEGGKNEWSGGERVKGERG